MSGRGGGGRGRGRGWYYKEKYARGNSGRHGNEYSQQESYDHAPDNQQQQEQWQGGGRSGSQQGTAQDLQNALQRLEGKSYTAYHDVEGAWVFQGFTFILDRAQSDPFAAASRCRVLVPAATAKLPPHLWASRIRRTALCDFLTRSFATAVSSAGADVRTESGGWSGNKGGEMTVDAPSQHVLERTSCQIDSAGAVEARFTVGLPARGRSILGAWAAQILVTNLPRYVRQGLHYEAQDAAALAAHVACVEDTQALRDALPAMGLVAFVGDGAILPRQSGASDAPMDARQAVPFCSPDSMAEQITVPNAGTLRGMGVRQGVTLVVGGGFHGKSTLLEALEAGVYNKVPGDGRERVATVAEAVKIRAEDGRRVEATNISPFIANLPFGKDTACFRSPDASGSTSQAANIAEALEVGARCLLLDEDTCATNFMIRDARMQALVAADKEPITPFIAKIRALVSLGVSSILVMGGAGDYFGVSDVVVRMESYSASDATAEAKAIDARFGTTAQVQQHYGSTSERAPVEVYPGPPTERVKVTTRQTNLIQFGEENIELAAVGQLMEKSQTRAIADALNLLRARCAVPGQAGQRSLAQLLTTLEADMDAQGLDVLAPGLKAGNLARPRRFEIAAALNRLRMLKMRQL